MSDVYCRYHCTSCDAHFRSLTAFDAHKRVGVATCATEPRGQWRTREGFCRLTRFKIGEKLPALVWSSTDEYPEGAHDDAA